MKEQSGANLLRMGNIIGFLATVTVNALANILPINGKNTGELSDAYPNLFTPAGITFAIWGLIYLALTLFTLYQAGVIGRGKADSHSLVRAIGFRFMLASAANIAWIFFWHYEQVLLSMAAMLVLLGALVSLWLALKKRKDISGAEAWCMHYPVGIYLGWISVATIANATALLVDLGWDGFGISESFWTVLVMAVASLISLAFLARYRNITHSLVVIWAFAGILIKHLDTFDSQYTAVIMASIALAALLLAGMIVVAVTRRRRTA